MKHKLAALEVGSCVDFRDTVNVGVTLPMAGPDTNTNPYPETRQHPFSSMVDEVNEITEALSYAAASVGRMIADVLLAARQVNDDQRCKFHTAQARDAYKPRHFTVEATQVSKFLTAPRRVSVDITIRVRRVD